MQLTLTYFDMVRGPEVIYAIPPNVSEVRSNILTSLMDFRLEEGFFEHRSVVEEILSIANYIFQIPSEFARGNVERLMLSLIVRDKQNPMDFRQVLEKFILKIKAEPSIFLGLYYGTRKEDPKSAYLMEQIKAIVNDCYKECEKKAENLKVGKFVVFGLESVGKSSIIHRLTSQAYDPLIKPTLGWQIIKYVVESSEFKLYDIGGQKKIRDTWFKNDIFPNAIIFVTDCSKLNEQKDELKTEFNHIINFHKANINKSIPVLILGNKIDLLKKSDPKLLERILEPATLNINYHTEYVSALTNENIIESFKWLVNQFLHD
jgi:GTPase SAR1 family protein